MKVLIVVDMQNDFIDGSLGTQEAQRIVENVAEKIQEFKANNDIVIFTRDTHTKDYLKTQEGINLPVEHCIKHTQGWKISDKLDNNECEILDKNAFGSIKLPKLVVDEVKKHMNKFGADKKGIANLDEIVIVGLCTDICVISNALILKAALPETKITVIEECCAGVTPKSHKNALEAMKMCQITIE